MPLLENEDGERAKSDLSHDKLTSNFFLLLDRLVKARTIKITPLNAGIFAAFNTVDCTYVHTDTCLLTGSVTKVALFSQNVCRRCQRKMAWRITTGKVLNKLRI